MPIRVNFDIGTMAAFILVMTRVGSALLILPLPGFKDLSRMPRIVLVVSIAVCLYSSWPTVNAGTFSGGRLLLALLGESAAGLLLGLAVAFVHEAFQLTAQAVSLQSGFSFASVFDPSSKADSSVFQVITQMATGLLFFITDTHLYLLRLLSHSYDIYSASNAVLERASLKVVLLLGTQMFVAGLKMALPLVVLLLLIELSLALLGRLHAQLQLITLSFPVKSALSFAFLAGMMLRWPHLYEQLAARTFRLVEQLAPL